jgi:hypothetical protein
MTESYHTFKLVSFLSVSIAVFSLKKKDPPSLNQTIGQTTLTQLHFTTCPLNHFIRHDFNSLYTHDLTRLLLSGLNALHFSITI